ncbi:hypothetical protein EV421DRAFT_1846902 [Armillaria borealis]|uniref:Secreted protein n=1 Tax=Armillaria borealis TaxID=47425 RepID=A0AA39MGG1_9AGAR|nr:hypothetical protein EV421DRAFT_1846902 [Armillaria borealis]
MNSDVLLIFFLCGSAFLGEDFVLLQSQTLWHRGRLVWLGHSGLTVFDGVQHLKQRGREKQRDGDSMRSSCEILTVKFFFT